MNKLKRMQGEMLSDRCMRWISSENGLKRFSMFQQKPPKKNPLKCFQTSTFQVGRDLRSSALENVLWKKELKMTQVTLNDWHPISTTFANGFPGAWAPWPVLNFWNLTKVSKKAFRCLNLYSPKVETWNYCDLRFDSEQTIWINVGVHHWARITEAKSHHRWLQERPGKHPVPWRIRSIEMQD